MGKKRLPDVYIENGQLLFKNFEGVAKKYNHEGDRNFCVYIDDPAVAEQMSNDGWNVKISTYGEDADNPRSYIKVNISYRFFEPDIYVISGRRKTRYTEDMIDVLDKAYITSADLTIQPSVWVNETTGEESISGYLREGYFHMKESHWADKYNYDEVDEDEVPFD